MKSLDGITKWCPECKLWKEIEDFHLSKRAPDGHQDYCAPCSTARNQAWRNANKDTANAAARARRKQPGVRQRDNETQKRYRRDKGRFRRYDLTKDDYLAMIEAQGRKCPVCLGEYDWETFPLFIDHDHVTGAVRGLLCAACNKGLGHFYDDPARLARAIEYLKAALEAAADDLLPGTEASAQRTSGRLAGMGNGPTIRTRSQRAAPPALVQ